MKRLISLNKKPNFPVKINRGSEFTKGVQTFQIVNSHRAENIAANNLQVLLRNTAHVKIGRFGKTIHCDGTDDVIDCGINSRVVVDASSGYFTIAVLAFNRGGDADGNLISKRDGATTEFQFYNVGGVLAWRTGGTAVVSSVPWANSDGWCWLIAVFNQDNANDARIHKYSINSRILTSATIASGYSTPVRQDINMSVGARWNVYPTTAFQGAYDFAAWGVWDGAKNGAWSDAKVKRFVANPWDIVQPIMQLVPQFISEVAAGNPWYYNMQQQGFDHVG